MSRTPFTVVTAVNSVRKLSNTADTGNTRHPCIHVKRRRRTPVTNSLQEFEKKKKDETVFPFEKLSTPVFSLEEERQK